ncbi:MAG: hypothetical protein MZW92_14440 [Comamonadaceae bacterium]|nr:hypothetical protein [Comamonadaceae bacterium]
MVEDAARHLLELINDAARRLAASRRGQLALEARGAGPAARWCARRCSCVDRRRPRRCG